MSTFGGLMEEYQSISIDRFDGANLNSSVFMLSHNHKDHTVGLSSDEFLYRLRNNPEFKLYCSPVTRDLLLLDDCLKAISKSIVPLEIDSSCVIDIPNTKTGRVEKTVTVTLLQAGHCPGSVMFLFEGDEGTVLYTGDFRLTRQDLASCLPLHSSDGCVKEMKSLYADTTFCVPRAFFIPKREDSISATIDLVREWISRSRAHIILLSYKANLGYEHMFMRLSEEFQMKIHVHGSKFEQYKKIGNLADFMTSDPAETQIHACKWHLGRRADTRLPCAYRLVDDCLPVEVRTVALSTMCFVQTVGLETYTKRLNDHFFRVCYSFHSSYSEIRDMILYLKPDRVFPNVIPAYDDASAAQLQKRLNSFVKLAKRTHQSALNWNAGDFGLLKSPKGKKRKHSSQQSHTSDSLRLIFDEDDKHYSEPAAKAAKCDEQFRLSSKSDSKELKVSDSAHGEFPLLFGSQICNGNSGVVTKSPSSDQRAEDLQNFVQASETEHAGGDGVDLDRESAITEESDTDPEMEDSAAFVLEPGSLVSYMSDDDSDGPGPPTALEPLTHIAPDPLPLTTPEPLTDIALKPLTHIAPDPLPLTTPEPLTDIALKPLTHIAPDPLPLTTPEPLTDITLKPLTDIAPDPLPLTTPQPLTDIAPDPLPLTTPEPLTDIAPDPLPLTTPEPLTDIAPDPLPLTTPEPLTDIAPDPLHLTTPEPLIDIALKPLPLTAPEPLTRIAPEPLSLTTPVPLIDTAPEPLPLTAPASPLFVAPESSQFIGPTVPEPLSFIASELSPPPIAPESPSSILLELPHPAVSKSPSPITPESQIEISANLNVDSTFQKIDTELSVPDEKFKVELKDTTYKVPIEDTIFKVESIDAKSWECESKSPPPAPPPSCALISNGIQACVNISEESDDLSDVIVVDDNSDHGAADPVFVWLNGSNNSQMHTSQTIDSDITVDVSASPYKQQQVPATVSLSDVPAVSCECIDLSSDDSSLHSPSQFNKDCTAKVAAWCDNQMVERDHVAKNSDGDSLSDDYEGDDEFEETDKESGYDSDAEIISNRKCTYECVIKERALRFSRTAVNGSDVIVIDDDDVNDAGTNYMKDHHRFARYSSTASSSSSSESSLSTGSPENFFENALNCNDSAVPQNSNNRVVFLHRSNKPRLWPRQLPPPCNTDGIKLSSSDDMFSS